MQANNNRCARRMTGWVGFLAGAALFVAVPARGGADAIRMKNGSVFTGTVALDEEAADSVALYTEGGRMVFEKRLVASVAVVGGVCGTDSSVPAACAGEAAGEHRWVAEVGPGGVSRRVFEERLLEQALRVHRVPSDLAEAERAAVLNALVADLAAREEMRGGAPGATPAVTARHAATGAPLAPPPCAAGGETGSAADVVCLTASAAAADCAALTPGVSPSSAGDQAASPGAGVRVHFHAWPCACGRPAPLRTPGRCDGCLGRDLAARPVLREARLRERERQEEEREANLAAAQRAREARDAGPAGFASAPGGGGSGAGGARTVSSVAKSCGRCGAAVSPASRVGQACPHCGAVWGAERWVQGPRFGW
ncbi:MAG: hypothetical protein HZA54_18650 [Planctomycetes bacterium]|nr:hypothetical protein [Planctomycetota bacterium]